MIEFTLDRILIGFVKLDLSKIALSFVSMTVLLCLVLNSGLVFGQTASAVTVWSRLTNHPTILENNLKYLVQSWGHAGMPVAIIINNPLGHVIKVG